MPKLSGGSGGDKLRELDSLAADARGLLRRAGRLRERLQQAGDPQASTQADLVWEATEQLQLLLEQSRRQARETIRQQLLGPSAVAEEP